MRIELRLHRSVVVAVICLYTWIIVPTDPCLAVGTTETAWSGEATSVAKPIRLRFGSGRAVEGTLPVSQEMLYTLERGYGFEPGSQVTMQAGNDGTGYCTSDKPFYFSVLLPEGTYRVTVTFGGANFPSDNTVKAELRRLMLEKVHADAGQTVKRSFSVNVRTPTIPGGGEVHLKARERSTEFWDWDDKLTLEFNGVHPCIQALEIVPIRDVVTVYILGDSTVCDQPSEPWDSWGQMLPRFFQPGGVVANHAESGETLRSSLGAKRLDKVLSSIQPGDYLFLQYGHNDMKEKGEGVGAFTTYKASLKHFIEEARKRGATPVLVTPMHRKRLDGAGKVVNTLGDYPEAVRALAKEEHVALIGLNAMSAAFYESLGPQNIDKAFQDGTHHNNYGAYELARCVVVGIDRDGLGIAKLLSEDALPFDPAHPDPVAHFDLPASPIHLTVKPDGN